MPANAPPREGQRRSSVTPTFNNGLLHPHTSARMPISTGLDVGTALWAVAERAAADAEDGPKAVRRTCV